MWRRSAGPVGAAGRGRSPRCGWWGWWMRHPRGRGRRHGWAALGGGLAGAVAGPLAWSGDAAAGRPGPVRPWVVAHLAGHRGGAGGALPPGRGAAGAGGLRRWVLAQRAGAKPAPQQAGRWAHLLVHHAIRVLLHQAALQAEVDPDRLSFTRGLHIARRQVTSQAAFPSRRLARAIRQAVAEALRHLLPTRRLRSQARVVKRKTSNFPRKRDPIATGRSRPSHQTRPSYSCPAPPADPKTTPLTLGGRPCPARSARQSARGRR